MTRRLWLLLTLTAVGFSALLRADSTYQKPPKEILELMLAPALPNAFVDPTDTTP